MTTSLEGRVAWVTGASRGAGKGIALALGHEGATVIVTGRSTREASTRTDLPYATIDDTADAVNQAGGHGIAIRCDHTEDAQVQAAFDQIMSEHGRIDLLVNNVWGGYEEYGNDAAFDLPFWEQPLWRWDRMFQAGVRAHFTASQMVAPRMMRQGAGLIVNTTFWDRGKALSSVPYDLAKRAITRMAYMMALDLKESGVTAVAVSPGWMRTESVLCHFDLPPDDSHRPLPDALQTTESVFYIGRAICALAKDPEVGKKDGQILTVGALAREYGFTDIDGTQPPAFEVPDAHLRD